MNETRLRLKERFQLSRFLRGEKPSNRPVTLSHRRIFILPTAQGLGWIVLIILILLIAFVYNNNLAYLLAFLLAGIFFITILHTFNSLAGLTIKPIRSHNTFVGSSAGFELAIDNPSLRTRPNLKIKLQTEQYIVLKAVAQKTVTLYSDTDKRGPLPCATITFSSTYPLGLFRAWSPLRFNLQALVYPKPAANKLPFPEAAGVTGEHGQGRKGNEDFYGIKSYQNGDPIRQIHWKAFAKGQGLYSKEYAGAAATECWLDYTITPGHGVEERLSRLCRWIIDAEQAGIPYGLVMPGTRIEPSHGLEHYRQCLETLALFQG